MSFAVIAVSAIGAFGIPSAPADGPTNSWSMPVPVSSWRMLQGTFQTQDGQLFSESTRSRAIVSFPTSDLLSVSVKFRILGNSAEVQPDSDGVTRDGITVWMNYQDPCNQYFLSWRTDNSKPGKTVVGALLKHNPGVKDLQQCDGIGYSNLTKEDGRPALVSMTTDIMDGHDHELRIVRTGVARWKLFADGAFVMEAGDPAQTLQDQGLVGLRIDNIKVLFVYQLELGKA